MEMLEPVDDAPELRRSTDSPSTPISGGGGDLRIGRIRSS
jgi:hypothetical protein